MWKDWLVADIELQVCDALGIGRPPVGCAQLQLFRVDPIQLSVEQRRRAIARETRLLERGDFQGVKILLSPERNAQSIGRQLWIALGFGGSSQLLPLAAIHFDQKQIAIGLH